jgi:hypothetical protein
MAADDRTRSAVYALKQRLEALKSEKSELLAELARLQCNQDAVAEARAPSAATGSVNAASDAAAKIKLFRSLFRGRDEVFPRRWQSANSGKSVVRSHLQGTDRDPSGRKKPSRCNQLSSVVA